MATFVVPHSDPARNEKFQVRLTEIEDVRMAIDILAGRLPQRIPVGALVRGKTDVNIGYTWSIDPNNFTFAQYALKVCDVMPSFVDTEAYRNVRSYCPWSGRLIGLAPLA
ncbi:BP74-related protein [Actinokineospora sp. HUAS TT18]|uniref:BP74-related protein n=1 Tax=Actinokineospora sp. HUAS TT18 TaxID=3447451 RepID=UPI003F528079